MEAHFLDWHQPVVSSWLVQQLQSLWELVPPPNRSELQAPNLDVTTARNTAARSLTLVSWLCKGMFFWLLKFSWCPWEVMTQADSDLTHFNICQISSCFVPIRNRFHHSPIFLLIWAHTKRVIQRCIPMHLAPSCIPGWLTTQVSVLPNPFSWVSPLLFFVGSTNSKRKFFNDVQFCFYSMMQ